LCADFKRLYVNGLTFNSCYPESKITAPVQDPITSSDRVETESELDSDYDEEYEEDEEYQEDERLEGEEDDEDEESYFPEEVQGSAIRVRSHSNFDFGGSDWLDKYLQVQSNIPEMA